MAVAERLEAGCPVGRFELHGYDYPSLQTIGWNHWTALRQSAGAQSQLTCLVSAMDLIGLNLHSFSEGEVVRHFASHQGACRWLVAQHVAYEANQDEVRGDLAEWFKSVQPNVGFVTGPWFKANVIHHINPFGRLPLCRIADKTPRLDDDAPAITSHRREIAGDHAIDSVHLLRGRSVSWDQPAGNGAPYALRYLRLPER